MGSTFQMLSLKSRWEAQLVLEHNVSGRPARRGGAASRGGGGGGRRRRRGGRGERHGRGPCGEGISAARARSDG
uniref:Uncharacterized protein n=1 Tax=Arundo donax TaxID=35708 RepID=A0A0A8ZHH2_ARUDO